MQVKPTSKEASFLVASIAIGIALFFFIQSGIGYLPSFSLLYIPLFLIMAWLSLEWDSPYLWIASLGILSISMLGESIYKSGWEEYHLGMNIPMRLTLVGSLVLLIAGLRVWKNLFFEFTAYNLFIGLLLFYLGFWGLSILGNETKPDVWWDEPQIKYLMWSVLFGIVALAGLLLSLRYPLPWLREFSLTFLLVNLYSRFIEFGWDRMNKAIFFGLLAISFWGLGKLAERYWRKEEQNLS